MFGARVLCCATFGGVVGALIRGMFVAVGDDAGVLVFCDGTSHFVPWEVVGNEKGAGHKTQPLEMKKPTGVGIKSMC